MGRYTISASISNESVPEPQPEVAEEEPQEASTEKEEDTVRGEPQVEEEAQAEEHTGDDSGCGCRIVL